MDFSLLDEFCLLGYNAIGSVESKSTFRRNMSPPYSRSKNKQTRNQLERKWKAERNVLATCFHIGFFLVLFSCFLFTLVFCLVAWLIVRP
jgi:hypothetical protein